MSEFDYRERVSRDLFWAVSLLFAWLAYGLVAGSEMGFGVDSHAYWAAWRGEMYDAAPATRDAYLYSPAFAHLTWPLAQLPWAAFWPIWTALSVSAFVWLVVAARWYTAIPLFLLATPEILTGNINWIMGLVLVLGSRHPWLWSLALLTKVTTFLGPVWFLVRGEWRNLVVSTLATCGLAAGSFLLAPELWRTWVEFLSTHSGSASGTVGAAFMPPLVVRLPLALALVVWGARTSRYWTLAVGMLLASPVAGLGQLALLLAIPRLNRLGSEEARSRQTSPPTQAHEAGR